MLILEGLKKGFALKCCGCKLIFLLEENDFQKIQARDPGVPLTEPSVNHYFVQCPKCDGRVYIGFRNFSMGYHGLPPRR